MILAPVLYFLNLALPLTSPFGSSNSEMRATDVAVTAGCLMIRLWAGDGTAG